MRTKLIRCPHCAELVRVPIDDGKAEPLSREALKVYELVRIHHEPTAKVARMFGVTERTIRRRLKEVEDRTPKTTK